MTLLLTKFSEGMSSSPVYWRCFSCSMMSASSGSTSWRGALRTRGHCYWVLGGVRRGEGGWRGLAGLAGGGGCVVGPGRRRRATAEQPRRACCAGATHVDVRAAGVVRKLVVVLLVGLGGLGSSGREGLRARGRGGRAVLGVRRRRARGEQPQDAAPEGHGLLLFRRGCGSVRVCAGGVWWTR